MFASSMLCLSLESFNTCSHVILRQGEVIPPQFHIQGIEIHAASIKCTTSHRACPGELGAEAGVASSRVMSLPVVQPPLLILERQKCG